MNLCFVFFFKQKTAYEMRISDWSSDVCSSVLGALVLVRQQGIGAGDGGKFLRCLRIVLVPVGMQFLGELPIGRFDLCLARAARDAQGGVGISHCRQHILCIKKPFASYVAKGDRKSTRLNSSH